MWCCSSLHPSLSLHPSRIAFFLCPAEANLLPAVTPELLQPPRPQQQGGAQPEKPSDPSPLGGEVTFLPPKDGMSSQDVERTVVLVEEGTVQILPGREGREGEEEGEGGLGGGEGEADYLSPSAPGSEMEIGQLLEGGGAGGSSSSSSGGGAMARIPGSEGGLEEPLLTRRRPRLTHQKSLLEQLHIGTPRKVRLLPEIPPKRRRVPTVWALEGAWKRLNHAMKAQLHNGRPRSVSLPPSLPLPPSLSLPYPSLSPSVSSHPPSSSPSLGFAVWGFGKPLDVRVVHAVYSTQ